MLKIRSALPTGQDKYSSDSLAVLHDIEIHVFEFIHQNFIVYGFITILNWSWRVTNRLGLWVINSLKISVAELVKLVGVAAGASSLLKAVFKAISMLSIFIAACRSRGERRDFVYSVRGLVRRPKLSCLTK